MTYEELIEGYVEGMRVLGFGDLAVDNVNDFQDQECTCDNDIEVESTEGDF